MAGGGAWRSGRSQRREGAGGRRQPSSLQCEVSHGPMNNTNMVYGVCNAESGYHSQAYSSELQHYYAQCQSHEVVQGQTYIPPALTPTDHHRPQHTNLQDAHVPSSYTNLDDYSSVGYPGHAAGGMSAAQHHVTQGYDYTSAVQAAAVAGGVGGQTGVMSPASAGYPGYLDPAAQYRHMSMGLYAHHDGVREACGVGGMMGGSPHGLPHHQPQQTVPTYKWMQVKRNVPKPGKDRTRSKRLGPTLTPGGTRAGASIPLGTALLWAGVDRCVSGQNHAESLPKMD